MKKERFLFVVYYMLIYMTNSVYGAYIYIYYKSIGLSLFQIGVLSAIGPVFSILVQPLWSVLCDRAKYRTTVLKIILIGSLLSMLLYQRMSSFSDICVVTVVYMLFSTAIFPISDSISVEAMKKCGFNFSTIRMGGTIGYVVVVVLAGYYFKSHLNRLFQINAVLLLLCLIAVCLMKKENSGAKRADRTVYLPILKNRKLIFVLFFIMMLSVALSFDWSFLGLRINELHYSNDFIGYASGLASLTEIPVLAMMPRCYKKFGIVNIILFAGFMLSARLIICFFATDIVMILASQLLQGFTYMTVHYSTINYINDNLPHNAKSFGQSLLAISQSGFGSMIGTFGGGCLSSAVGISPAFGIIGFSLLAISAVCIAGKRFNLFGCKRAG